MHTISTYQITEQLYEGTRSLVYRGYGIHDDVPVILKVLKKEYPPLEYIAWLKREYETMQSLNIPGVARVYTLDNVNQRWFMVLEDFGGDSLSRLGLAGRWNLGDLLHLAISLTTTLRQIHQRNIMHKDITPANIVYNPVTRQVKLIDFGIATILSREHTAFQLGGMLEGTVAYMSPEQTGRMNRPMDYRTDFYSFGVTLYELLTGHLPFASNDIMKLIHSHIALQPVSPHEHIGHSSDGTIIHAFSLIILKLMAKNAEDRYQSAQGLKTDLEYCLQAYQDQKTDTAFHNTQELSLFTPGQHDQTDQFHIPHKLYGRKDELSLLLATFERISTGGSELVLISGPPGIGKSSLVQELYRPVTLARGYFVTGAYNSLQQDTPYLALIQAYGALIRQVLTEPESSIHAWRHALQEALGSNGNVLIDIIPEVEWLLGLQPEIAVVGAEEAANRLTLVFEKFITVFATPAHPLVLFLDDMQWADKASLKLISQLMQIQPPDEHDHLALLLIVAYRNTELAKDHPFEGMIQELVEAGVHIQNIALERLDLSDATHMIADTLAVEPQQVEALAACCLDRTGGNPFFLHEFLTTLYIEQLIDFDYTTGTWQWNLDRIALQPITDNVVDLIAAKISRLPPETQSMLTPAACVGNVFDLALLADVAQTTRAQAAHYLDDAIQEGMITPLGEAYKVVGQEFAGQSVDVSVEYLFTHDRIRQAVYMRIPTEERTIIHWRIGHVLLKMMQHSAEGDQTTRAALTDDHLFDCAFHLNQGRHLIASQDERIALATLNLQASKKAKATAAYETAHRYVQIALETLTASSSPSHQHALWSTHYDVMLDSTTLATETACLNRHYTEMKRLADEVLQHARTLLDRVPVYEIEIQAYSRQRKLAEALQTARLVLAMFDISFPEKPARWHVLLCVLRTKQMLFGKRIESFAHVPAMTDPHKLAAMRILASVADVAYFSSPMLFALIVLRMLMLSVTAGNAPQSAFAYAAYAVMLCGRLGDSEGGYRFGQVALTMLEHQANRASLARIYVLVYHFTHHWKRHIQEALAPLQAGYTGGLDYGDLTYAAYALYVYCARCYLSGRELGEVAQQMDRSLKDITKLGHQTALNHLRIYHQAVVNLTGATEEPWMLHGDSYNEATMVPLQQADGDGTGIFLVHFHKLILAYMFGNYAYAREICRTAESHVTYVAGVPPMPVFYFYDSLVRLALVRDQRPQTEQYPSGIHLSSPLRQHHKKIAHNQAKIKKWSHHAPMNFYHKWLLVEAERAGIAGDDGRARELYDEAIAQAEHHGYLNDHALACELAGRFYNQKDLPHIAYVYLYKAYQSYKSWGAINKVMHLEESYPHLVSSPTQRSPHTTLTTTSSMTTSSSTHHHASNVLDLHSVMQASQTISGELMLDSLLKKLLLTVFENAGADRGVLILDKESQWVVEAQGTPAPDDIVVLQSIPIVQGTCSCVPLSLITYVAHTRDAVVLHDAMKDNTFQHDPYIQHNQSRSLLCLPLMHKASLIGMLYLENRITTGAFTTERLEVLNLLSSQMVISIEAARLYTNLQASEKKYRTLFEESRDTIFISTPDGRFLDVSPSCESLLNFTREEILAMPVEQVYAIPEERARFRQQIERTGSVRDFEVRLRKKDGTTVACLLTATLRYNEQGNLIGYQGIARDITALKRAELERVRLSAFERELSVARDIQNNLLPPAQPNWKDLDMVCYSQPAREVGGDLFVYHAFNQTGTDQELAPGDSSQPVQGMQCRYAIAVGDISGKGMPAALLMAVSIALFRSLVHEQLSPAHFVQRMGRAIIDHTRTTNQNCALVYLDIAMPEPSSKDNSVARSYVIRVANAGCITPLVRRVDGSLFWVDAWGFPLGVELSKDMVYTECTVKLYAGDSIILMSDGVIEARNANDDMLGFYHLEKMVKSAPATSAQAILDHIRTTIHDFVGTHDPHDDITLVVMQF